MLVSIRTVRLYGVVKLQLGAWGKVEVGYPQNPLMNTTAMEATLSSRKQERIIFAQETIVHRLNSLLLFKKDICILQMLFDVC